MAAGHAVAWCVLVVLEDVVDVVVVELEVAVEELEGMTEELMAAVEEGLEVASAACAPAVDLEPTLMTFLATRAPTTAPAIIAIVRTTASEIPRYAG